MSLSKSHSNLYLIQETSLLLIFSYLVFFGSSKFSLINPVVLIINAFLFTLLLLFFILKPPRTSIKINLPLAGMMGVMFLTSLTSIDPRRSLSEFILVSASVCLFFLVAELVNRAWPGELIIKIVLIVGFIFMGLCWSEFFLWYSQWWVNNPGVWLPNIPFRSSNPNLVAVMVNVWLMVALGRLFASRDWISRIFLSLWVVSALGVLYLTSSRGGWLGSAAGFITLFFIFLRTQKSLWESYWKKIKTHPRWIMLFIILAAALALAASFLLIRQLNQPSHGSRNEFWTPALQAFTSSPIVGKGPFTFISAYLQANSVPPFLYFDYAHSIYMDLLSGSGILGLLAFVWLIFSIVKCLWGRLSTAKGDEWAITVGSLAALSAFCVHGTVDSVHHTEPISLVNLSIILGVALSSFTRPGSFRFWESAWKVVLAVLVVCFSWFNVWAVLPFQAGITAANAADWQEAERQFQVAAARDFNMAITHQQLGYVLSQETAAGNKDKLQPAIAAFQRAVQLDPYWALNEVNLGALYHASGNLDAAQSAFTAAVRLAPDYGLYALNLGELAEEKGDFSASEESYRHVLSLNPDWRDAYFWRASAFRQKVRQKWISEQPNPPAPQEPQELEKEISLSPTTLQPYLKLAQIYFDRQNYDQAESVIHRADRQGLAGDNEMEWLKAELFAAHADFARASASGDNLMGKMDQLNLYAPGLTGNLTYAVYMFRRAALPIDFIPQVQRITLNDTWGKRALELAVWFDRAGNPAKAQSWSREVQLEIPDINQIP